MSLSGVRSNRGDGYQTLVAIGWAISIIASDNYLWLEIDSTSLDANGNPISVDDVVVGCADGSLICSQCKKNQIDFNAWSIVDLGDELVKAAQFLADNPNAHVKFYSRNNFGDLAKLREHVVSQPNEAAYRNSLARKNQKTDADLGNQISKIDGLSTFEWLGRTTFETTQELERMEELLMERLSRLVSNADNAFNALWMNLDKLGARINRSPNSAPPSHRLSKADLLGILEKSGANLIPQMSQQMMKKSFADTSAIGRHWRRDIAGKRLQIFAVNELISVIESGQRSVLLTGIPGSGKTCTLLELQDVLETRNDLATLFIQAREYANCQTPDARIAQGLPDDFVGLVGRMADSTPTVVIVDSLDVLSLSREHDALSFFLAQIDRLLLITNRFR